MLSEEAGFDKPYWIKSLLGRSFLSADALWDFVHKYAIDALDDPEGVLVADETGFLKRARIRSGLPDSIRVQRGEEPDTTI